MGCDMTTYGITNPVRRLLCVIFVFMIIHPNLVSVVHVGLTAQVWFSKHLLGPMALINVHLFHFTISFQVSISTHNSLVVKFIAVSLSPLGSPSIMPLALDDPATLRKLLQDYGVPATVCAHMELLGYKTVALLGYSIQADSQLDDLLAKLWPTELGEQIDLFSPGAASLRRTVKTCFEACQESRQLSTELPMMPVPKPKLTLSEYRDLKAKFQDISRSESQVSRSLSG